jgi:hypothetical protein
MASAFLILGLFGKGSAGEDTGPKLHPGIVVGIVLGILLVSIGIPLGVIAICKWRQKRQNPEYLSESDEEALAMMAMGLPPGTSFDRGVQRTAQNQQMTASDVSIPGYIVVPERAVTVSRKR